MIDRSTREIFNSSCFEKAKGELIKTISDDLDIIKKLNKAIGPVEIEKKEEVVDVEEEESVKEEKVVVEEKVVKIDTFKSVLNLYISITNKKYDQASSLVDLLRENINRYEDLKSLNKTLEDARMYLDFNQSEELDKLKKDLLSYLNERINLQTKLTSRATSPSSIINELIELQRQANEVSSQYIDSSDRPALLTKIARVAADAQAFVVYSFKFYKKRSNHLYLDLYQNSVQVWENILSLFDNSSDDSIKRCFRSIRRLLADLSYIPDDLSYLNSRNVANNDEKSEFSKSLSIVLEKPAALFSDTALVISLFAYSPIRELYDINVEEPSKGFNEHMEQLLDASKDIIKLNNRENAEKVFNNNKKKAEKSFESFASGFNANPTTLKKLIEIAQNMQTDLQAMCAATKNMSDVAVRHPDYESVAKLPSRVTMPSQSSHTENAKNDEKSFKDIFNSLQKLIQNNETKNKELRNFLFESTDVNNDEVADQANQYIQFVQDIVAKILSASNSASNISIGENLAASASYIVISLENFNKAIKSRFLLRKDWGNGVNSSLDSIAEESDRKSVV